MNSFLTRAARSPRLAWILLGAILGGVLTRLTVTATAQNPGTTTPSARAELALDLATFHAEIDLLKVTAPDCATLMNEAATAYGRLWFAGQKRNWPLAEYYWTRTRDALRRAIRSQPVRKDSSGADVSLIETIASLEKETLEDLRRTLVDQSADRFRPAYAKMLDRCQACHRSAGRPYLRLQIPRTPETPLLRTDADP